MMSMRAYVYIRFFFLVDHWNDWKKERSQPVQRSLLHFCNLAHGER